MVQFLLDTGMKITPSDSTVEAGRQLSSTGRDVLVDTRDGTTKRKFRYERESMSEPLQLMYRKTKKAKLSGNENNLKFACPYFKRDPTRFTRRQACSGPGFSSISRVKEHIYRAHRQPDHQCIRCYQTFMEKDLLEEHLRAAVPCEISTCNFSDGVDEAQYIRLRRKPSGDQTDIERWEDIYRIIFPKASIIPSCFYESHDTVATSKIYSAGLKHVESTLIAGIERDLEDRFDQVGTELKASFIHMIRERLRVTIKQFLDKTEEPASSDLPALTPPADTPVEFDLERSFDYDADLNFNFQQFAPLSVPTSENQFQFDSDTMSISLSSPESCLALQSQ